MRRSTTGQESAGSPRTGNAAAIRNLLHCYSPQDIQSAYNYGPAYTSVGGYASAGEGQTIVIFDAYGDPTVRADLATFDAQFGLPGATLNVICPAGCPIQTGASPQTSLSEGWAGRSRSTRNTATRWPRPRPSTS